MLCKLSKNDIQKVLCEGKNFKWLKILNGQKVDILNIVVEPGNRCLYYLNFEAEKTAVSRKSVRIHNRVFCLCS